MLEYQLHLSDKMNADSRARYCVSHAQNPLADFGRYYHNANPLTVEVLRELKASVDDSIEIYQQAIVLIRMNNLKDASALIKRAPLRYYMYLSILAYLRHNNPYDARKLYK